MEYGFLSAINNNPYYESSNIQLAYLYFNFKKDYEKALTHYQKTFEIASSAKNQILSRLGIMICSYQTKNYEEALQTALNLEKETELPEIYKYESKYYIAMSHYWLGNKRLAEELLLEVSKEKNNIKSAESAYYYALTLFEKNESKKSNEFLFKAKDDFASYEYWVIKYFILIAQNYNQMKDYFQAQATLESIINNYKGDQNLILEAKKRLAEVEKNAKLKSKVNYEIK
jgi:tetratricopeptide (TPR) repeat protein